MQYKLKNLSLYAFVENFHIWFVQEDLWRKPLLSFQTVLTLIFHSVLRKGILLFVWFCFYAYLKSLWFERKQKIVPEIRNKGGNEKNMQMKSKHIKIILIKSQYMWLCVIRDAQKVWEVIKYLILTFTRKILIYNRNRRQNDFPK